MDDAAAMRGVEGAGDLGAIAEREVHRQWAFRLRGRRDGACPDAGSVRLRPRAPGEPVGERLALEILHDEEVSAILVADVVQCADVGVIEC